MENANNIKMDRILLKMSGEALAGDKKHGFDETTVKDVSNQVKQIVDKGIQVCVVIGGGNFSRGRTSDNMDRVKADSIGMLATVMNCIYTADSFRSCGIKTHIMTPFICGNMTELFDKDKAIDYMEQGDVVFFAGGIGHPYFSTDMATVLMAIEVGADVILSAVLAMENKMPMMLFGLGDENSIVKAVTGGFTGTYVRAE